MNPRRQVSAKVAQTIDKQIQEVIQSCYTANFHQSLVISCSLRLKAKQTNRTLQSHQRPQPHQY